MPVIGKSIQVGQVLAIKEDARREAICVYVVPAPSISKKALKRPPNG